MQTFRSDANWPCAGRFGTLSNRCGGNSGIGARLSTRFRSVAGRAGRSPSERPAEAPMSHVFDLKDIFVVQGSDRARDLT